MDKREEHKAIDCELDRVMLPIMLPMVIGAGAMYGMLVYMICAPIVSSFTVLPPQFSLLFMLVAFIVACSPLAYMVYADFRGR